MPVHKTTVPKTTKPPARLLLPEVFAFNFERLLLIVISTG